MLEALAIGLVAIAFGFVLGAGLRTVWILRDMHSARRDARTVERRS